MPDNTQSSSLLPPALRWAGPPLAFGYGLGGKIHRAISSPRHAGIPTICIGNITVGGTGKTPATKYFARGLVERGRKPAVLLRGYKGQGSDEAVELQNALADLKIPILIGADRYASSQRAKEQGCDCVLLDDGFQHWKLARDLDIVLIDATDPFGGGHLAPWGKLREAPEGVRRAGVVIITRSDAITETELASLKRSLSQLAPTAVLAAARHEPVRLKECREGGAEIALERLHGAKISAACGIGNPNAFTRTLQSLGAEVLRTLAYPDHCDFDATEADTLTDDAKQMKADALVVTEKDAAKLKRALHGVEFPVWALEVRFKLSEGDDAVWARVGDAVTSGWK